MAQLSNKQILDKIRKAIRNKSEDEDIEFKDARGGLPKGTWQAISAFSHKPGGGFIVFGIKERRKDDQLEIEVVGGLNLSSLQEKISELLGDKMQNTGRTDMRILPLEDQQILVVEVSETPDELKPCFNKAHGLPKGACIRVGNTNITLTDHEMREMIRNSAPHKFDKTEAKGVDISMLAEDKIKFFLDKSAEKTRREFKGTRIKGKVLKNVGILGDFEGKTGVTLAGYLIFSKLSPQILSDFARYVIRCVRYQGEDVASNIVDSLDVDGTLDLQIELAYQFIIRNMAKSSDIKGTKRIDKYEYPQEAIRELVANAVIHRDYMITETYSQINIFSNRVEISNPGNLPPGITVENIKDSQFSRNEFIARILKDLDYLEEYGRGIDIVLSKMEEWGLTRPIFKNMANSFKVVLLGKQFKGLNDRQIKIWQTIQNKGQSTVMECAELFPSTSRSTINKDLRKLVDMNLIVLRGFSASSYYEPKY